MAVALTYSRPAAYSRHHSPTKKRLREHINRTLWTQIILAWKITKDGLSGSRLLTRSLFFGKNSGMPPIKLEQRTCQNRSLEQTEITEASALQFCAMLDPSIMALVFCVATIPGIAVASSVVRLPAELVVETFFSVGNWRFRVWTSAKQPGCGVNSQPIAGCTISGLGFLGTMANPVAVTVQVLKQSCWTVPVG